MKRKGASVDSARVRNPWDAWYKTVRWVKSRAGYLRAHPFCARCEHEGRYVVATDLDHIVPVRTVAVKGMPAVSALFWDFAANVQGLCHSCHSQKTAKEDGGFGRAA